MNLLFVNMTPIYHNTSANIRMCGVIAGASKNGHVVDLLTMKADEDDYSYESHKEEFLRKYITNYYTFKKSGLYQNFKEKGDETNKTNSSRSILVSLKLFLKRVYKKTQIYDAQFINVKNILEVEVDFNKYDRIISVSDPKSSNRLVYELIKKKKLNQPENKWIQYWGDPWLIDITQNYGWKKFLVRIEESMILSKAYKVVYTSPLTLEVQRKMYEKEISKMICVNQPARDLEDRSHNYKYVHYMKREEEGLSIAYIGSYAAFIRNIKPLYECCLRNQYHLDIIGDGDKEIASKGTVRVIKSLPHDEAETVENDTDILVCLCNRSGTQIPGKIFYIAALDKPIVVILDGERKKEIKKYLSSFERYIICDNNKDTIKEAIEKAKAEIKNKKRYVLSPQFDDTNCAMRLID